MDHTYSIKSALICPNEWTPTTYKHLDDVITDFMVQQNIPGASLAISLHNRLIYTQGYGVANTGQRVLSTSLFRLASISKPITATAVMKLVETEQLQLDQKIFGKKGILSEYKPSAKGDKRLLNVTVKDLLQHSGGWDRDQVGDAVFWKLHLVTEDPYSDDAIIKYIMKRKLQFTPGKRHAYSNLGYLILGKVIERVTGMPYVDFIREIYKPIPVVPGHGKQSNCHSLEVKYYNNRDNILESSIYPGEGLVQTQYGALRMEGTESYGGWVMSAPELLQLFNYISSGSKKLLCEESFKLMVKKPSYELGHQWYGLGLDVQDNGLSWGHTGAMDGTSTTIHHHKSGLTWALLFNSWSKDMDLDGLVKYGLAMIPSLPLWIQDTVIDQFFVKSEYQFVYLLMPYEKFCHVINLCDNYYLSHVNMIRYGGSLCVNSVWTKSQFKHYVFIDKNISDVQPIFKKCNLCYSYVYLLESYKFGNDVYYIVGLQEKPVRICQEIYIHLNATLHLNQIKSMKAQGYVLRLQTVVVLLGSLFVSSVYDKEELSESKSWLQITLENFVVELGTNSVKNLAPLYTNCFSVDDEPYISATWVPGKDKQFFQRHDVSIYGFLYEIQDSMTNNVYVDKICAYYNDGVLNFLGVWSSEL